MYYCEVNEENIIIAAHTAKVKDGLIPLELDGEFRVGNVYIGVDKCIEGEFVPATDEERKNYQDSLRTEPDIEALRSAKKSEIGNACTSAIYAGVEVDGKHYSLNEHDQIELMAQYAEVKAGALAVPYHADGELCCMYSADEFGRVAKEATAHIFYNRTYCNHVNKWIARADTDELSGIVYGCDLPDDLRDNMLSLLSQVGGDSA